MKKKIVLCLLLGCMMSAAVGCNSEKVTETSSVKEQEEDKEEDKEKEKEEDEEDKKKDEKESEEEDSDEKKSSDTPVLGDEDVEDYEGFEYLSGDILISDSEKNEETGKNERKKLAIFLPMDDYSNISGDQGYASSMGVTVSVELEPYIRYDQEDYLLEENLEHYLEHYYDPFYRADYKDLVVSEAEEVSKDACRATAEYCLYNKYNDSYTSTFVTYYLAEVEKGTTVLVTVEVSEDEVTGKTHRLIEELEEFYPFEIDWDKDRAQQKREAYIASGGDHMYSTGYMLFELPENWDEVTDGTDYNEYAYAPEGDVDFSGCVITFQDEYLGSDEDVDIAGLIAHPEETKEILEESLGESVTEFEIAEADTCLGKAAKISYAASIEGIKAYGEAYFVVANYDLYIIQAFQLEDATEDPFVVLDDILQNAQIWEW